MNILLVLLHASLVFRSAPTSSEKINNDILDKLAYFGDFRGVTRYLQHHKGVDWSKACCSQSRTAIHYALQGRMDAINRNDFAGQHEDVIQTLCLLEGFNTSHGCPLYYAMHYRNIPGLQVLLNSTDHKSSLQCLTSIDTVGLTALHSSCMNKASGFSRLYATALHRQKLNHRSLHILGLNAAAYLDSSGTYPIQISMASLLNSVGSEDMQVVLRYFGAKIDLKKVINEGGSTLLHVAASAGRTSLVRLLIDFGADVRQQDSFGMTALHAACCGGFSDTILELLHNQDKQLVNMRDKFGRTALHIMLRLPNVDAEPFGVFQALGASWPRSAAPQCLLSKDTCPRTIHRQTTKVSDIFVRTDGGEWFSSEVDRLDDDCHIDRRNTSLSEEEFVRDYLSIKKPVILSGFLMNWPAVENWRRSRFTERYGHLQVEVNSIPYSSLYGIVNDTQVLSLRKFLSMFDSFEAGSETNKLPPYLFDANLLTKYPKLAADVDIPGFFQNIPLRMRQFILGPRDSGAPPHFHGSAYNALVYGQKKWFIWKPEDSFFSFQHIKKWLSEPYSLPQISTSIQCVQHSGDIIFIPENWGHAVINKQPSIAVAAELH